MVTLTTDDIEAIAEAVARRMANRQPAGNLPSGFLPLNTAIVHLPVYGVPPEADPSEVPKQYRNQLEQLRFDLRKGEFKSGSEAQKKGRLWLLNVQAYSARKQKEQSRKKVC